MKERVSLSKRPLKNGVVSLFLDYRVNGTRRRENLKLYLQPERTLTDKAKNGETMRVASALRDRKEFELEQIEAGIQVKARPTMVRFDAFAKRFAERYRRAATLASYESAVKVALEVKKDIFIQEMDSNFFKKMVAYMTEKGNKANTIRIYTKKIITVLKQAKYDGLIQDVPHITSLIPKSEKTIRQFLTLEEVRKMAETDCENDEVKAAFLFSCFTGLRYSDVCSLKPSMLSSGSIVIRQQKTSEPVIIPMSENARQFLPHQWEFRQFVFNMPILPRVNYIIKLWGRLAGITKHLHYHISRHTFATLMISNGADLYVTSKLLGHSSIRTTEVYAKIVDEQRRKAVDLIPKI